MSVARTLVRSLVPSKTRRSIWSALHRATKPFHQPEFEADGVAVWGKSLGWLDAPRFEAAYRAGLGSGHSFGNISIQWRVHMACWAARHGLSLDGDFVECGVHTGVFSLAICHYLDWNSVGRKLWLLDTFAGIPESQMHPTEREHRRAFNAVYYQEDVFERATRNFAPYRGAILVRGPIPDTLPQVDAERVAFLHLDMNIALPEVAAAEYFWPRMPTGAVILLDDYGFCGHEEQRRAMDRFAAARGVQIATLPTGQGLLLKPGRPMA
jgi:O-methyltransferase